MAKETHELLEEYTNLLDSITGNGYKTATEYINMNSHLNKPVESRMVYDYLLNVFNIDGYGIAAIDALWTEFTNGVNCVPCKERVVEFIYWLASREL